ncbi:D-2-hydroxyacid dehydrogenase [Streptomyces sp. NPDC020681]|uniref:D-2-hydroxyacid dehydrogenase n=1 Tax=Streptomyces sp. NPDC020681 TaxID=3365083 RepID=UPI0037B2AEF2
MTERSTVVVGLAYPPSWDQRAADVIEQDVAALRAIDSRVEVVRCPPGATTAAALARLDILVALHLAPDVLRTASRLRWVQAIGAGVGHLLPAGLDARGIRLSTASGVNAVPVAEFAFARVLAHFKRFAELDRAQCEQRWTPYYGEPLAGRTLGVLGLGAIGTEVAVRARAFGMRVSAVRRSAERPAPHADTLYGPDGLRSMLAECDAVVAALPETPQTVDMMDEAAFAAMPAGAFFCNVGRGSCVVEEALVEALRSGQLGGAAIDVARLEPLPAASPLWHAPNLAISAHSASAAGAHFDGVFRLLRKNLARYLAGETLINEVDTTIGY